MGGEHSSMPWGLSKTPFTEAQCEFGTRAVHARVRRARRSRAGHARFCPRTFNHARYDMGHARFTRGTVLG